MIKRLDGDEQNEERQDNQEQEEEIQINPEWMDTLEKGAEIGKSNEVDTSEKDKD